MNGGDRSSGSDKASLTPKKTPAAPPAPTNLVPLQPAPGPKPKP
jgi:hypothetical protein